MALARPLHQPSKAKPQMQEPAVVDARAIVCTGRALDQVHFTELGEMLTVSHVGTVQVWATETAEALVHVAYTVVSSFLLGRLLCLGLSDHSLRLWDTELRRPAARLEGHTELITDTQSCGALLFTSSLDGRVAVWDWTAVERRVLRIDSALASVNSQAKKQKLLEDLDRMLLLEPTISLKLSTAVHCLAVVPPSEEQGGKGSTDLILCAGTANGVIKRWRGSKLVPMPDMAEATAKVTALLYSPEHAILFSSTTEKSVCGWDPLSGRKLFSLALPSVPSRMAVSGHHLYITTGPTLLSFMIETGVPAFAVRFHTGRILQLRLHGGSVYTSSADGSIAQHCRLSGKCCAVFKGHLLPVADFSVQWMKKQANNVGVKGAQVTGEKSLVSSTTEAGSDCADEELLLFTISEDTTWRVWTVPTSPEESWLPEKHQTGGLMLARQLARQASKDRLRMVERLHAQGKDDVDAGKALSARAGKASSPCSCSPAEPSAPSIPTSSQTSVRVMRTKSAHTAQMPSSTQVFSAVTAEEPQEESELEPEPLYPATCSNAKGRTVPLSSDFAPGSPNAKMAAYPDGLTAPPGSPTRLDSAPPSDGSYVPPLDLGKPSEELEFCIVPSCCCHEDEEARCIHAPATTPTASSTAVRRHGLEKEAHSAISLLSASNLPRSASNAASRPC